MRLPENEIELTAAGEWVKQLVLAVGGSPETAFACSYEWTKGLRALMNKFQGEDWEL